MSSTDGLAQLSEAGVSIWLDDLSREMITSGKLAELISDWHLVGVTTNPTIFAKAVSESSAYDEQLRTLASRDADADTAVREITTSDVADAADTFRDVHTSTGGMDGRVSIEVDPRLAHQTEQTVAQVLDLWKTVDRPNIFVKIPATREGLPAITRALAEGACVNVTLVFSLERYREVIEAFFSGLEEASANGYDLSSIHSVASFFVSRVDSEIDKRLEAIGTTDAHELRGQAAIANARLAYAQFEDMFSTERWRALRAAGANPQRPLWASTGVKNPDYSPTRYVDELVVAGTVNTMPDATMEEVSEKARITGDTVTGKRAQAQAVFDRLTATGIDLDDVYRVLEEEGVEKFEKSWNELLDTVHDQLNAAKR